MTFTPKTLLDHPFSFAMGVGLANGLLAKARDKQVDARVATTLAAILGLGETALVMYEPQSERGPLMKDMTLMEIGVYSALGVLVGLIPFMSWSGAHAATATSVPIASSTPSGGNTAVSGYAPHARRHHHRRRASSW